MRLKTITISISILFIGFDGIDPKWHHKNSKNSHVIYPMGKPMPPQLLRCKGFAVKYYPPPYFGGHPLRLGSACPVKCEAYFTGAAPSTFATSGLGRWPVAGWARWKHQRAPVKYDGAFNRVKVTCFELLVMGDQLSGSGSWVIFQSWYAECLLIFSRYRVLGSK